MVKEFVVLKHSHTSLKSLFQKQTFMEFVLALLLFYWTVSADQRFQKSVTPYICPIQSGEVRNISVPLSTYCAAHCDGDAKCYRFAFDKNTQRCLLLTTGQKNNVTISNKTDVYFTVDTGKCFFVKF